MMYFNYVLDFLNRTELWNCLISRNSSKIWIEKWKGFIQTGTKLKARWILFLWEENKELSSFRSSPVFPSLKTWTMCWSARYWWWLSILWRLRWYRLRNINTWIINNKQFYIFYSIKGYFWMRKYSNKIGIFHISTYCLY